MKTKPQLILLFLSFLSFMPVFSQMKYWYLPSKKVDVSSYPTTSTNLPTYTDGSPYLSNGIYNSGNSTLYYFDETSSSGPILRNSGGSSSGTMPNDLTWTSEIEMIPYYSSKSGSCTIEYFVFFNDFDGPSVLTNNLYYTRYVPGTGFSAATYISTGYAGYPSGYAISKITSDKKRYIYTFDGGGSGTSGLRRIPFDENVLTSSATQVVSFSTLFSSLSLTDLTTCELELSHNNDKVVWTNWSSNKFYVINLNTSNGSYSSSYSVTVGTGGVTLGVEFDPTGNYIYASHYNSSTPSENGIYVYNISGTSLSGPISGTSNFNRCQLEYSLSGHIVGANATDLVFIKIATNTVDGTQSYTNPLSPYNTCYMVPDQVDGEIYPLEPVGTYDLYLRDEPNCDAGGPDCIGQCDWSYIWESPDLWNSRNNQWGFAPEPIDGSSLSDNYVRINVVNKGCVISQPSEVHIYWTRGRSDEPWDSHWDGSLFCPTNSSINWGREFWDYYQIPPIPPGANASFSYMMDYSELPDFIGDNCFDLFGSSYSYANPKFTNGYPMICLLARVVDANDPMCNEQTNTPIAPNVSYNNNIVTRNTWGQIIGREGKPTDVAYSTIGLTQSLNDNPENGLGIDLLVRPYRKHNDVDYSEYVDVYFMLSDSLWQGWLNGGQLGYNLSIEDSATHTLKMHDSNDSTWIYNIMIENEDLTEPFAVLVYPKEDFYGIFDTHQNLIDSLMDIEEKKLGLQIEYYDSLDIWYPDWVEEYYESELTGIREALANITIYRDLTLSYIAESYNNGENEDTTILTGNIFYLTFRDDQEEENMSANPPYPDIKAYPNPFSESVTFSLQESDMELYNKIEIFDISGRSVGEYSVFEIPVIVSINIPPGQYIAVVSGPVATPVYIKLTKQ